MFDQWHGLYVGRFEGEGEGLTEETGHDHYEEEGEDYPVTDGGVEEEVLGLV